MLSIPTQAALRYSGPSGCEGDYLCLSGRVSGLVPRMQWWVQRRGPGDPGPPIFLDQTKARKDRKKSLTPPPPPYLRVWMTGSSFI